MSERSDRMDGRQQVRRDLTNATGTGTKESWRNHRCIDCGVEYLALSLKQSHFRGPSGWKIRVFNSAGPSAHECFQSCTREVRFASRAVNSKFTGLRCGPSAG